MSAPFSTRRAALGAILATPLAFVPAVAATSTVSAQERQFLAIGPRLVELLDQHDRLWAPVPKAYKAWEQAKEHLPIPQWEAAEALPEWQAYVAVRAPADAVSAIVEPLYEPFIDIPLTTLPAIMLRHRYGMSFEAFREDALDDLDRLWREGTLCA